jgi:hypothetical protein
VVGADRSERHLIRGGKFGSKKNLTVNLSLLKNFASILEFVLLLNRPLLRMRSESAYKSSILILAYSGGTRHNISEFDGAVISRSAPGGQQTDYATGGKCLLNYSLTLYNDW